MIQIQTVHNRAQRLLRQATLGQFVVLKCEGCHEEVDVESITPEAVSQVEHLIEHCAYEHLGREGIVGVAAPVSLVGGYALAASIGAVPRTENEEQWRASVSRHPSRRHG